MTGTVGSATDSATDSATAGASRCPCGSGDAYAACCGRHHRGEVDAPTAEALMRSRYTAFVLRDTGYLARTWHPSTRPDAEELQLDDEQRWVRLDVLETRGGGPFDDEGVVLFEARWRRGPERGVLRERSTFVREQRRWTYLDGELA
ncbi:YchJ family protein [Quadrisphaera sp. KR29]|uniref:YchJ family protein n=1 Tax=Quadrisphaera sp. KR29 TaxID=3461391 RepID=UPI0040446424